MARLGMVDGGVTPTQEPLDLRNVSQSIWIPHDPSSSLCGHSMFPVYLFVQQIQSDPNLPAIYCDSVLSNVFQAVRVSNRFKCNLVWSCLSLSSFIWSWDNLPVHLPANFGLSIHFSIHPSTSTVFLSSSPTPWIFIWSRHGRCMA
jgi:hypothetical protein